MTPTVSRKSREELSPHLLDLGSSQTIYTTEKKRYSIRNQLNVEEGVGSGNAWCGKLLSFKFRNTIRILKYVNILL